MFRNYALVAMRNIFRHKLYSLINIGGLAIGLTAVIMIALFVRHEFSYDSFWENGDKVYRFETTFIVPGRGEMVMAQSAGVLQPALEREMAQYIQASSRIVRRCFEISHAENHFSECADFVDPDFFKLFNFEVVAGNGELALANNTSIMISESVANKYFGREDVVSQTLIMNDIPYTVVAVMKDLPQNSHINSDMIGLFDESRYLDEPWVAQSWTSVNVHTYFMLKDSVTIDEFDAAMPAFLDKNVTFVIPGLEDIPPNDIMKLPTINVPDIHLFSTKDGNMRPAGNAQLVYTFAGVAFLVLVIAGINFMNLSTARATQRAREVSIRKVMGARRSQLVFQFLGETVLLTFLGLLFAVALTEAAMPLFSAFLGQELVFTPLSDPGLALGMLGIVFLIGIGAGIYPALILSGFRPAEVLQSNNSAQQGSSVFRNVLVVAQFSISIGLMAATGIFYGQTVYATNVDMGYEKENRVVLRGINGDDLQQKMTSLRAEFMNIPGVMDIAFASDTLPLTNNNNALLDAPGGEIGGKVLLEQVRTHYDYFRFLGVEPVAGRLFSRDHASDLFTPPEDETEIGRANIIINELAVPFLGFESPAAALNQQTTATIGSNDGPGALVTIIGVVPNIIFRSTREDVTPMFFLVREDAYSAIFLELDGEDQAATLAAIDETWKRLLPEATIFRSFIDENIDRLYRQERQQASMFLFFSIFAIFIASLGLFGMASFTAQKRTKEIGLRKVMGASVSDIMKLLLVQFSKPVLWSNLVAWPIVGYFMFDWLNNFTMRLDTTIIVGIFVFTGLVALLIAGATVSGHALRAARANPITAIRAE